MADKRPPTPDPIKRILRQEAGFGCCKCGLPILDYHHIVEYAVRPHFDPADMMVLCPNHHREATVGAMQEPEQRRYKAQPANRKRGYVSGLLKVNQTICSVRVGSVELIYPGVKFSVDDDQLMALSIGPDQNIQVSLTAYDQGGTLSCLIENNEWISGDPAPWDVEAGYHTLRISNKLRDIALSIDARRYPIAVQAKLWKHGTAIRISEQGVTIRTKSQNLGFSNIALFGASLEMDSRTGSVTLGVAPGLPHLTLISARTPRERLWQAQALMNATAGFEVAPPPACGRGGRGVRASDVRAATARARGAPPARPR